MPLQLWQAGFCSGTHTAHVDAVFVCTVVYTLVFAAARIDVCVFIDFIRYTGGDISNDVWYLITSSVTCSVTCWHCVSIDWNLRSQFYCSFGIILEVNVIWLYLKNTPKSSRAYMIGIKNSMKCVNIHVSWFCAPFSDVGGGLLHLQEFPYIGWFAVNLPCLEFYI